MNVASVCKVLCRLNTPCCDSKQTVVKENAKSATREHSVVHPFSQVRRVPPSTSCDSKQTISEFNLKVKSAHT